MNILDQFGINKDIIYNSKINHSNSIKSFFEKMDNKRSNETSICVFIDGSAINNGKYTNILKALSSGKNTADVLKAVNKSPWGTDIPGYGGGSEGVGISTTPNAAHSGVAGGHASLNATSQVNVTLKMDVKIASSSTADAERMVQYVGKRLKEEFGNGAFSVKSIASMG